MDYIIQYEFDGKTVKDFIIKNLDLSSKMLTRLKHDQHGIILNGNRVTVRAILKQGDVLSLGIEREQKTSDSITPVNIPLDIIYEDEYYIVLNKPANMPTHPSHDHRDDTLANALAYLYTKSKEPFVFRAVNRLDRDTSGIVIFAKSAIAASKFSLLQQNKFIAKEYIAITSGVVSGCGSVEGYIRRKANSIMLREFSADRIYPDDAYSLTTYTSLASTDKHSLLHLSLHTGRTHQIRVHMQSLGAPVLGDGLYGKEDGEQRHMLHAYKIGFVHPFTEKQISITAKIPSDFLKTLSEKGINYEF